VYWPDSCPIFYCTTLSYYEVPAPLIYTYVTLLALGPAIQYHVKFNIHFRIFTYQRKRPDVQALAYFLSTKRMFRQCSVCLGHGSRQNWRLKWQKPSYSQATIWKMMMLFSLPWQRHFFLMGGGFWCRHVHVAYFFMIRPDLGIEYHILKLVSCTINDEELTEISF